MKRQIVILTGEREVGKSTVCERTAQLAEAKGHDCAGIVTLRDPSGTLSVKNVGSEEERRLTVPPDTSDALRQGRFLFAPDTLAWGNQVLAAVKACELLIVDEMGPLEFERGLGWQQAFDTLGEAHFSQALVVIRPELLERATACFWHTPTEVLRVTLENRDRLPSQLVSRIADGANGAGYTQAA
jgi:nucleoside-triphosphatase THEP1